VGARWMALPALAAGAGIAALGARYNLSQLYGPTMRYTGQAGTLALTFDDGPNPSGTPALLDLLEKYEAKATFFLIGENVSRAPGIVREISARGHAVGNHTETHPSLLWLTPEKIARELRECQDAIAAASSEAAVSARKWLRPPYGSRGPQLEQVRRSAGFDAVVMWSLTCFDWNPQPKEKLIARLKRARWDLPNGRGGHILLLHDGWSKKWDANKDYLIGALQYWLPRWHDAGVKFVSVEQIAKGA
jgi:peptidoglycan/xylan/chitin deacetylase (PgdA/CDA1 family)